MVLLGVFLSSGLRTVHEDLVLKDHLLRKGTDVSCCSCCSLLLLLFALFVLFVFIRGSFTVIICEIDLFRELDPERALLDPGRFRFQSDGFDLELFEHTVVHARDHVGRLDERERETRLHVDGGVTAGHLELDVGEEVTQSLLLREHVQIHCLLLIHIFLCVLSVVLVRSFEVFLGSRAVSQVLVEQRPDEPQLRCVLLRDSI